LPGRSAQFVFGHDGPAVLIDTMRAAIASAFEELPPAVEPSANTT
jgi:hypothetical protein